MAQPVQTWDIAHRPSNEMAGSKMHILMDGRRGEERGGIKGHFFDSEKCDLSLSLFWCVT